MAKIKKRSATATQAEMNRFNLAVRSNSVDEEDRSVEVVLATENRVKVYDYNRRQVIEEVLLMDGMERVDHLPMLNDHSRWSLDSVLGSVTGFRVENKELIARFRFADLSEIEGDEEAKRIERAWLKVKQGHLKGVSVGYRVMSHVDIEPRQTKKVRGVEFTAGDLPLRVASKWKPYEGSLTVVQADEASRVRKQEENQMNKKLREHLVSLGMRKDATVAEAWAYLGGLQGNKRSAAEELINNDDQLPEGFERSQATEGDEGDGENQAPENQTRSGNQSGQTQPPAEPTSVADQVRSAIETERNRVAGIQETFRSSGIQNDALMTRAINENWTPQQTAQELLPMVRSHYQSSGNEGGHVGIHSVRQADSVGLAAALMLREGVALDHPVFESQYARSLPQELRANINSQKRQQALEIAHRYDDLSLVDICRMGLQMAGQAVPANRQEMVRSAINTSQVQSIFTTNISAMVLAAYMDAEDTTMEWTTSSDVANFQTNERHGVGKYGPLKKHGRGGKADAMDVDANVEEYKIARYSGQVFTDEQDIIDDRLNALSSVTPSDMGLAARQLRADLVYAELLANANLADGVALFHAASHGNLFTTSASALGFASLSTAVTAIKKQRIKGRPLNLSLKYLLVPADLMLLAERLTMSAEIRESVAANGTANVLSRKGLIPIADDRLGLNGVTHPSTGVHYAGTAINWFAACQPGVNGARTIEVGYLRGTGRAPQINSWVENRGQWGIGHAVKMDIGAKPLDFRCLQKHVGS